ncbi:hypothetical protein TTSV1_gp35 [Thermoproteus tenax spherical virus 1]|uniref:Uncharacterized protein n=1 Tax=Thermoproteus tenax spherical virus 1 TaxID=292639 RepID=Q647C7_9VIRU|nr:hypothetical protein TTSV1_gp35 [Thermoproteus tenax spherical virus 1]AAU25985.1 hypothetical protein [Thermoproteus tenax spherical virus 1]
MKAEKIAQILNQRLGRHIGEIKVTAKEAGAYTIYRAEAKGHVVVVYDSGCDDEMLANIIGALLSDMVLSGEKYRNVVCP